MNTIPDTEMLESHINQAGITTGPKKLDIFRKACELRGVPKYKDDGSSSDIARVKLFDPCGSWTWYIGEWDEKSEAFGLVDGFESEYGYFSLAELSEVRGRLGIGIEVDVYFLPRPFNELPR